MSSCVSDSTIMYFYKTMFDWTSYRLLICDERRLIDLFWASLCFDIDPSIRITETDNFRSSRIQSCVIHSWFRWAINLEFFTLIIIIIWLFFVSYGNFTRTTFSLEKICLLLFTPIINDCVDFLNLGLYTF